MYIYMNLYIYICRGPGFVDPPPRYSPLSELRLLPSVGRP